MSGQSGRVPPDDNPKMTQVIIDSIGHVWCRKDLTLAQKAVYTNLASRVGNNDTAYPSKPRIAREMGIGRSTVADAVIVLEEKGLIRNTGAVDRFPPTEVVEYEVFGIGESDDWRPKEPNIT